MMNKRAERFWDGNARRLAGDLSLPERMLSSIVDRLLALAELLLTWGLPAGQEAA
ncbi:MAG: hypothetical protein ACI361_07665 [Atopobiaceae bacterium]